MSFQIAELRVVRRALERSISNIGEVSAGVRGREMSLLRQALKRCEKLIRQDNESRRPDAPKDVDRKPGLFVAYNGRPIPINGQAPEDLLEAFDVECEEIGVKRGPQLREIMVNWIQERLAFKRRKAAASQAIAGEAANAR